MYDEVNCVPMVGADGMKVCRGMADQGMTV